MNKARALALTAGLALTGLAIAQTVQRSLDLVVASQVSASKALLVNGQAFVPVSALAALGVRSSLVGNTLTLTAATPAPGAGSSPAATGTAGGSNGRPATAGCLNESLFNGVWRVRVVSVEPISRTGGSGAPGWSVTLELRNGTNKDISPIVSFDAFGKGVYLIEPDGTSAGDLSGDGFYSTFDKTLPPGGVLRGQARFYGSDDKASWDAFKAQVPAKFILSVLNPANARNYGVAYNTPTPSLRVDLTCKK